MADSKKKASEFPSEMDPLISLDIPPVTSLHKSIRIFHYASPSSSSSREKKIEQADIPVIDEHESLKRFIARLSNSIF